MPENTIASSQPKVITKAIMCYQQNHLLNRHKLKLHHHTLNNHQLNSHALHSHTLNSHKQNSHTLHSHKLHYHNLHSFKLQIACRGIELKLTDTDEQYSPSDGSS